MPDQESAAPQGMRRMAAAQKKEFPPPISRVAWEMKKYWTSDGRLIMREERVSHEYFRAYRSEGRLVLNLVHVDEVEAEVEEEEESLPAEIKRDLSVAAECCNSLGLKPCGGYVQTVAVFSPPVQS